MSTLAVAGIGAVSIVTGSSPVTAPEWNRASGRRPSSAARSLVVMSRAAQPSEICELLPAWMTPSSRKAGLSAASFSSEVSRRMPSSAVSSPSGPLTGTSWPAKAPSSVAAAALRWDSSANSSSWVRDKPQRRAMSSAPRPWLKLSRW